MRFLVDTNIWLELLLSEQRAGEVRQLFERCEGSEFAITEFSLYSIGIVLTRLSKDEASAQFVSDVLQHAGTRLVRLHPAEMNRLLGPHESNSDWISTMRTNTRQRKNTISLWSASTQILTARRVVARRPG